MADIENFKLDLRQLEPGTRFFDAEYVFHDPPERSTDILIDVDGNKWYRKDRHMKMWTVKEYEVRGSASRFITVDDDAPEQVAQEVANWVECDFYVRDVETGEDTLMYPERIGASLELEPLKEAAEVANRDHH
jgi:hypothetical protein